MADQGRFEKTLDKIRHGGVPVAMRNDVREVTPGNRLRCDGCGEGVALKEDCIRATLTEGLLLRLHEECYGAWVGYTP